ncbi:hypothetical protein SLOPH_1715 [Spraguea lophii 42_110]|uniref:Uncharacterized protein n=1 Tax=Spraguea lophii (strain 42_110) TaxID=1358809 RepID=S7W7U3_SPRLO|nr:hypothetical protein SLOPH_1715 [Spraguea lophii 42_110]
MISLEERLKTLKTWKDKNKLTRMNFSVCGFYLICSETECMRCFFCDKSLDGWERNDEPYSEHLGHSKKCILLNLHIKKNRNETFVISKLNNSKLMDTDFFVYRIKKNIDTLFCYICGYSTDLQTENISHECKNTGELFCRRLLKGEYNNQLEMIINKKICLDKAMKSSIEYFLNKYKYNSLLTVKEYLEQSINEELHEFEKEMKLYTKMADSLIEDISEIDNK